jgi:integrase
MPLLTRAIPRYRKHRASGQAIVTLFGQDIYLGPHGTKASKLEYDRVVAEWLARGRQPLLAASAGIPTGFTNVELIVRFKRHAEGYYRKNGQLTNEVTAILSALKFVNKLYAREAANDFGPLKLQAIQQAMITAGLCRRHINKQIGRIIRMYAWGVSQELVRADVAMALREVKGLHKGRTTARESEPVMPVDDTIIDATLAHLPPIVADMVRLQRLTGCRPEEVCRLRPREIDTSGAVWAYRPEVHKTQHAGRERIILIGPRGQAILRAYLERAPEAFCFSPQEGEQKRREQSHSRRSTPLRYGNRPGSNRRAHPARAPRDCYSTPSYRRAIARGCELAFQLPAELRNASKSATAEDKLKAQESARAWRSRHVWHPNQLRHSAATAIRKSFGLEAAQVALGHAQADVTQLYAERDSAKAIEVMRQLG